MQALILMLVKKKKDKQKTPPKNQKPKYLSSTEMAVNSRFQRFSGKRIAFSINSTD